MVGSTKVDGVKVKFERFARIIGECITGSCSNPGQQRLATLEPQGHVIKPDMSCKPAVCQEQTATGCHPGKRWNIYCGHCNDFP